MGKKNKFLLVSLQDQKAAELAQVISNATCRRILDYLSEHESITESQVSQDLAVPYNLQLLVKGGLVKIEEFHYSVKGKEVNHYSLANQYIIIAPKGVHGFKEKLRSILPVLLAAVGITALVQWLSRYFPVAQTMQEQVFTESTPVAQQMVQQAAQPFVEEASYDALRMASEVAVEKSAEEGTSLVLEQAVPSLAQDVSDEIANTTGQELAQVVTKETIIQQISTEPSLWHNIALWFFIGVLFSLGVYLLVDYMRKK